MAGYNYLILFVADALTTAIFGFIVLFGIRETRPAEAHHASHQPLGERISQLRRAPILLIFSFITLFFGMIYTQGYVGLPLDMQSHGLGPQTVWSGNCREWFPDHSGDDPGQQHGQRNGRASKRSPSPLSCWALALGSRLSPSNLSLFALSVAIWTLGEIAATSVAPTIIADLSPVELRGLYQGIFGAAWGLAYFIGPLVGGWVYENLGSNALWIGCLILGIVIAFCYYALSAPAKRHMAQSQPLSTD